MFTKQKAAMLVAEFLGTGVLTYVLLAVGTSSIGIGYFIALAAGLAVLILTMTFSAVSGAIFNPALTLGLWTVRKLQTYQAILYILVQLLGGVAAYALLNYLTDNKLQIQDVKFDARTLVAETVGTAIFAMGFAAAVYQHADATAKAYVAGGAYAIGLLIATVMGAAYLNPAIALSAHTWDWNTAYVLGPVLGAVIGVNLYNLLFVVSEPVVLGADATAVAAKPVASSRVATKTTAARVRKTTATKKKTTTRRKK